MAAGMTDERLKQRWEQRVKPSVYVSCHDNFPTVFRLFLLGGAPGERSDGSDMIVVLHRGKLVAELEEFVSG